MKKLILIVLIMAFIFSFSGCVSSSNQILEPVYFYYHNDLDGENDFDSVYVKEVRDAAQYHGDQLAMLNAYFAGPETEEIVNPFPKKLSAVSLDVKQDTASIVLSNEIEYLSGLELTMACSCLSMTIFGSIECNTVKISAEKGNIHGQKYISFARDSLILIDDTSQPSGETVSLS